MKKYLCILVGAVAVHFTVTADTIRQWDFNSFEFDIPAIGTLRPNDQIGFPAQTVGGVGAQFGQVAATTGSSDPNQLDNTHWRVGALTGVPDTGFPEATEGNKTTGAQFHVTRPDTKIFASPGIRKTAPRPAAIGVGNTP